MWAFVTPFLWSEPENSGLVLKHRAGRGVINVPSVGDLSYGVVLFHGEIGDGRGYFLFLKQQRIQMPVTGRSPTRCAA